MADRGSHVGVVVLVLAVLASANALGSISLRHGSAPKPKHPKPYLDPRVCKIVAFMAIIMGLGLLFYILLGFRQAWAPPQPHLAIRKPWTPSSIARQAVDFGVGDK